jgi:catechol 2,3-dioxygenase
MATATRIDPQTSLGPVELVVGDLDRMSAFYERAIGLEPLGREGSIARLGSAEHGPVVELHGDPDAPPRPGRSTGLFHLAVLVPSRPELARAVQRVVDSGWRFTGASDHLVSEALYLDDPEGNGIELYRDRPREEWSYDGDELRMATLPLDLDGVMTELDTTADRAEGARIGHVHLQVAEIPAIERFYEDGLGMDVTVRGYPSARFLSAGSYHHHLGTNTWASAGAPAPPPGARGLRRYTVVVPDGAELDRTRARLTGAGIEATEAESGFEVTDPSGNHLRIAAGDAA